MGESPAVQAESQNREGTLGTPCLFGRPRGWSPQFQGLPTNVGVVYSLSSTLISSDKSSNILKQSLLSGPISTRWRFVALVVDGQADVIGLTGFLRRKLAL